MDISIYDHKDLFSIQVVGSYIVPNLIWFPERIIKRFWRKPFIIPAGFAFNESSYDRKPKSDYEGNKALYVNDSNIIIYRAKVILYFKQGLDRIISEVKYFTFDEDAKQYADNIAYSSMVKPIFINK